MDDVQKLLEQIEKYKAEISSLEKAKDDVLMKCGILDTILDALPHPFYVVDAKTYSIKVANKASLLGVAEEGQTCYAVTHNRRTPCQGDEHPCPLKQVKKTKKPVVVEHIHYDSQKNPIFVELYGYPILDDDGNVVEMIEYSIDITKRKQAEQKLTHLATHDQLTGLPNRTLFNIRLDLEINRARRNKTMVAVMLLDLDGFKDVNDTYGHGVGDSLLKAVGTLFASLVRRSDTVARMGGDEFMVLLPDLHSEENALGVARKFVSALQEEFKCEGHVLRVNTSIGAAFFPVDGEVPDDLVRFADTAMYAAKMAGGGTVRCYDKNMQAKPV